MALAAAIFASLLLFLMVAFLQAAFLLKIWPGAHPGLCPFYRRALGCLPTCEWCCLALWLAAEAAFLRALAACLAAAAFLALSAAFLALSAAAFTLATRHLPRHFVVYAFLYL